MVDDQRVRCLWEYKRFPATDFDYVDDVGQVHVRGLKREVPAHTTLGDPMTGSPWHGTNVWFGPDADLRERSLARRARRAVAGGQRQ
jgi:hypothetical protein